MVSEDALGLKAAACDLRRANGSQRIVMYRLRTGWWHEAAIPIPHSAPPRSTHAILYEETQSEASQPHFRKGQI